MSDFELNVFNTEPAEVAMIANAIVNDEYQKMTAPMWQKIGWIAVKIFEPAGRVISGIPSADGLA